MTAFDATPVTPHIGAMIEGLDLTNPLNEACQAGLQGALARHLVLFFRDQHISPDDHVRLAQIFGEMEPPHPVFPSHPDTPQVTILENDEDRPPDVNVWHTDVTWKKTPPLASVLHCVECPPVGGDTLWSSMHMAYDLLSDPTKKMIESLTAIHSIERLAEGQNNDEIHDPAKLAKLMAQFPPVSHPVVRTHPVTGRKGLFVNWTFTKHIEDIPRQDSEAILALLYEVVQRPECQVRLRWKPGTIAVWDNRATQHYAVADYYPQYRCMHRITVLGDIPYLQ